MAEEESQQEGELTREDFIAHIKGLCQDESDALDIGILEAYKELPTSVSEKLDFNTYWLFHRKNIAELRWRNIEEEMNEEATREREKEWVKQDEEAKKERGVCKRCNEKARAVSDKDYCSACIVVLRDEAAPVAERIKEELLNDPTFQAITSEKKAGVYAQTKYAHEKQANKFVYPAMLGKQAYETVRLKRQGIL